MTDQYHQLEAQLMPLYYDINLLKSKIAGSAPEVIDRCDPAIRSLLDRLRTLESQVFEHEKEETNSPPQDYDDMENQLKDLVSQYQLLGNWIWTITSS